MNASPFIFIGESGRVKTTSAMPTVSAPNAVPYKEGAICIGVGMTPIAWVSGIPYGTSGRIVAQTNNNVPVAYYHAGLGFTASGRLACDETGEVTHYVRGIPITAEGRVAIHPPIVADQKENDPDVYEEEKPPQ